MSTHSPLCHQPLNAVQLASIIAIYVLHLFCIRCITGLGLAALSPSLIKQMTRVEVKNAHPVRAPDCATSKRNDTNTVLNGVDHRMIDAVTSPRESLQSYANSFRASSATTTSSFSFMPWPTISVTSCGRWLCRRRWNTGR